MPYIYITGGASSGKSCFALDYFKNMLDVTFIATGVAADPEMEMRISIHKKQRPDDWHTIEEPVDLIKAVKSTKKGYSGIIIDCITFWVSNLIHYKKLNRDKILEYAQKAAQYLTTADKAILVVTNELGMGVIPHTEEGRNYRIIAGEVNQIFAKKSKEAYLIVSGIPIKIK